LAQDTATEFYIGPSLHTVTRTQTNIDNSSKMVAPTTCNNVQERCIYGFYCTGTTDTCTGVCHPTCLKCNGPNDTNCTQCSPLSYGGKMGLVGNKCQGSKFIFLFY
jgi:hypothetical protein